MRKSAPPSTRLPLMVAGLTAALALGWPLTRAPWASAPAAPAAAESDPQALAGSQAYRDLWELTVTPNPNDWSSRNSKSSTTKHRPSAIGVSIIRAPTDAALHSGSPRY